MPKNAAKHYLKKFVDKALCKARQLSRSKNLVEWKRLVGSKHFYRDHRGNLSLLDRKVVSPGRFEENVERNEITLQSLYI